MAIQLTCGVTGRWDPWTAVAPWPVHRCQCASSNCRRYVRLSTFTSRVLRLFVVGRDVGRLCFLQVVRNCYCDISSMSMRLSLLR